MSSTNLNKKNGKPQAAGKGALDVFQCDNKDKHGKHGTPQCTTSTSTSSQPLPSPVIRNGKCLRCTMSDRVDEEVISCSVCCNLFHAVCRDKRGNYESSAISTKSFYDNYNLISNHVKPHQSRWGSFNFLCKPCSAKNIKALKRKTVKVKSSETQTLPQTFLSSECQTVTSGNIHELSINSVKSDFIDICNETDSHDCNSMDSTPNIPNYADNCPDLLNDIKSLTKLNEEVLENIKSLHKLSSEHGIEFGNKINDIKQSLKSELLPRSHIQNSSDQVQSNHQVTQNLSSDLNFVFDPKKLKPFKELHNNILDDEHLENLADFLEKSKDFKTIKSTNSSRDVSYYGEFKYRYGSIQHDANKIPDVIQSIVNLITEKYPKTLINSCSHVSLPDTKMVQTSVQNTVMMNHLLLHGLTYSLCL